MKSFSIIACTLAIFAIGVSAYSYQDDNARMFGRYSYSDRNTFYEPPRPNMMHQEPRFSRFSRYSRSRYAQQQQQPDFNQFMDPEERSGHSFMDFTQSPYLNQYSSQMQQMQQRFSGQQGFEFKGPEVIVDTYVRALGPLIVDENAFRVQLTFRQQYNDSRLAYRPIPGAPEYLSLIGDEAYKIWHPDTFFRNERFMKFHDGLQSNIYARIWPEGKVWLSQRVTMELLCPHMKKKLKDEGKVECPMDIASYGHKMKEMSYEWDEEKPVQITDDSKAFLNEGITLKTHRMEKCDVKTKTGFYSCIRLVFVFEKDPHMAI